MKPYEFMEPREIWETTRKLLERPDLYVADASLLEQKQAQLVGGALDGRRETIIGPFLKLPVPVNPVAVYTVPTEDLPRPRRDDVAEYRLERSRPCPEAEVTEKYVSC